SQLERVFQGAVDKIAEAGGAIAGGHTVIDREPKYGLAVTGRVHPERMLLKSNLRAGDTLWLTKPIGTGVLTTAHKNGDLDAADLASAIASMVALNRAAAQASVGGLERNRSYFDDGSKVTFDGVDDALRTLILDPQTSGGLLVGVPPAHAEAWQRACATRGVEPIQIGEVIAGDARVRVTP